MARIDADAPEPVEELIQRAGWAVAHHARQLLGGTYGKRVIVLAGPGNNGADGLRAAEVLTRWGARCMVLPALDPPASLPPADLFIDAAFGTGFRDSFELPFRTQLPVLAVDIPSGVDGLTGEARGFPLQAVRTVTFGAAKPGLLLGEGPRLAGDIVVENLGLDCGKTRMGWADAEDIGRFWPQRRHSAHKWNQAVWIVGGSAGMTGAVSLAATGALRSGAGYVAMTIPAGDPPALPVEAVGIPLTGNWGKSVVAGSERFGALAIGPGLDSASPISQGEVRRVVGETTVPLVLDAGALEAVAEHAHLVQERQGFTVLSPHDGEFERLIGHRPGPDRLLAATEAADRFGCVVLLKGPTTVVAAPTGHVYLSTSGDKRLATAGSGDVLSGVIAAGLAGGLEPLEAAGLAAELHGLACQRGANVGLTAGDLPRLIADQLSQSSSSTSP